jgi:hypothetical protein
VRPFPVQTATSGGTGIATGKILDRMRRGYMTVQNNAGVPTVEGQVYVRVAAAAAGKPIGGIEAAADGGTTSPFRTAFSAMRATLPATSKSVTTSKRGHDAMSKQQKLLIASSMAAAVAMAHAAPRVHRGYVGDSMITFDQRTVDSAGAFLIGELERLDQTLNMPLVDVTWARDIQLREDVTIADETSSFTNSFFAAAGGASPNGKSWVGKDANSIRGLALDIAKTANPLTLWAMELGWSIPELESAQRVGRPVDSQKVDGMELKRQMDIDEQIYVGDQTLGVTGLVNSTAASLGNALNGNWVEQRDHAGHDPRGHQRDSYPRLGEYRLRDLPEQAAAAAAEIRPARDPQSLGRRQYLGAGIRQDQLYRDGEKRRAAGHSAGEMADRRGRWRIGPHGRVHQRQAPRALPDDSGPADPAGIPQPEPAHDLLLPPGRGRAPVPGNDRVLGQHLTRTEGRQRAPFLCKRRPEP